MAKRRLVITLFVACWTLLFHYESLRLSWLSPWAGTELPKTRFLFPPAGWIMFYRVDPTHGSAEVYGFRDGRPELIDPHRIFETRWAGYDNIRRNILIATLHPSHAPDFCRFLGRKLPGYQGYAVVEAWIPDVVKEPGKALRRVAYRC